MKKINLLIKIEFSMAKEKRAKKDESKFQQVIFSVEKTIGITRDIIQKLESQTEVDKNDSAKIVNACLNIASELKGIPFGLKEIEKILLDIVRSIHVNRTDLEESVNILIKNTGNQLTKVTDATEKATSNIMDITDKLVEDQNLMVTELEKIKILAKENPEKVEIAIDELKNKIMEDQGSVYQIWDFLQFQDITTQQIEYAYNLLREAESKLIKVSDRLGGLDEVDMEIIDEHNTAFDPNASFEYAGDRQAEIDDLLNNFQGK
jgi:chemotaxis regulatin CheY-phosphate phosphatase CheZ